MQLIRFTKYNVRHLINRIKFNRSSGAICLLYHRVMELSNDPQQLCVSPSNFERQIRFIKRKFRVLSMDELESIFLTGGRVPKNSIVISFDDGYYDNYSCALQILEAIEVPAIFFVSTSNLNTETEFWWDEIERVILYYSGENMKLDLNINGWDVGEFMLSQENRKKVYDDLLNKLKVIYPEKRNEILAFLRKLFGGSYRDTHRSMSIKELIMLYKSKIAIIGAHTHNHPCLASLDAQAQQFEIKTSKAVLEANLQTTIKYFSYPFGTKEDYNLDSVKICNQLGFSLVASNVPGRITLSTNKLELNRFIVRNWNIAEFKSQLYTFR